MDRQNCLDLTRGSIIRLLLRLSTPVILSMLMFTLYLVADLYFVSRLGPDAVAGVSISSNAFFFIFGMSIILGTGGMALIARCAGAGDYDGANKVFHQVVLGTVIAGVALSVLVILLQRPTFDFSGGPGVPWTGVWNITGSMRFHSPWYR